MSRPDTGRGASRERADFGAVLQHRRTAVPLVAATVARLPLSMVPLGLVLLVAQERSSFTLAGATTGMYAAGTAVGSPLWGRLMDHVGQRVVLGNASSLSALLLVGVVVVTHLPVPVSLLLVLAFASGATRPAVTAAIRSAWPHLLADIAARRAAFVLDAVAVELLFVIGPVLLSALLLGPTWLPLVVAEMLLVLGAWAYSLSPAAVAVPRGADRGLPLTRVLAARGVPTALVGTAAATVALGCLITSLSAVAVQVLGAQSRIGLLYLAIGGGSVMGGFAIGSLVHRHQAHRLPLVLVGLLVGLGACAALLTDEHPPTPLLLLVLGLTGLWIAPVLIAQQYVVEKAVPGANAVEVQSWLATAIAVGTAVGSSVAGTVIERAGLPWAFAVGATGVCLALVVALAVLATETRRRAD